MCLKNLFSNINPWGRRSRSTLEFSHPRPTGEVGEPEEKTLENPTWITPGDIDPASPSKSLSCTQTCSSASVDCNIVHEESSVSTGDTDPDGSMRTAREQIKVTKRILAILVSSNTHNLLFDQHDDSTDGPHRGTDILKRIRKGDIEYFQAFRNELMHLKGLLSKQQKEEIIKDLKQKENLAHQVQVMESMLLD
eukprot:jgi/Picsp_1/853/NSC_04341-R1_---NA---